VVDTGQAAYRILVKREDIDEDPELVPFFENQHSYRWIGEKRHIIVSANRGTCRTIVLKTLSCLLEGLSYREWKDIQHVHRSP